MVMGTLVLETQVVVLGGGPGGYVAAIRAADLGKEVVLVDEHDALGGVCLREGCIPSKALIHAVETLRDAEDAERFGVSFGPPVVDVDRLRGHAEGVVSGLTEGVASLLERRGVEVLTGRAHFSGPHRLDVEGGPGVEFEHAIIATGSRPRRLPAAGDAPVWSSKEAVALPEVPSRLIVVGGGYIGLELGLVYSGLGSEVTVVEYNPKLLVGADEDLIRPVLARCERDFAAIRTETRVTGVSEGPGGFRVDLEHQGQIETLEANRVLVSIGRVPNTDTIGLDKLGLEVDAQGRIPTDEQCRTAAPHVFAIGDVAPGPMLAHKASREAKVAAEVLAEHKSAFDNRAIPAVVFTAPEIAWAGLTEREARAAGRAVQVGRFPLRALGRARTLGRTEGLVKVLAEPDTGLVLGVGMVGPQVSDLIAEGALAIEMGATLEDLVVTIHPHPTLSEAIMEAAEVTAGVPVHLPPPRR